MTTAPRAERLWFRRQIPLGPARVTAGWVLALAGPPVMTVLLLQQRDILGLPTDLMFFFTLVVGTALVGGLFPSLACAVLGSSLLNYFFTQPTGGLTIDEPEQALAVVLFTLVAIAVASLVDVAERRSLQAREAQAEATTLAELSRAVLGGADTPQRLVDELARRFESRSAVLLERPAEDAPWAVVATCPADDEAATGGSLAEDGVVLDGRLALVLPGRVLSARDRRVLSAFAAQAALVLERERLRVRALRAQELEHGNAVRNALLSAASHDLRTPLASIRAAVDGLAAVDGDLADTTTGDDRAVLVETIDVSTTRLERLIDNLLDLSMIHTGALRPDLRPASLEEFVPSAVEGAGAEVVLEVAESLPLVTTDPGLLERVLANLVSNASRFSTGAVLVRARATAFAVEIHVADDGPGVPAEDRVRMFEPFQRLGDVPGAGGRSRDRGLGLGLAVARGLSDAVGARLEARETAGGGLTMVLTVPRTGVDVPEVGAGTAEDGQG